MSSPNRKQLIHLNAELWPNAAKQQGWDEKDRRTLYNIYAQVLGEREPHRSNLAKGGRISAKDFVQDVGRDDFGDVKNALLVLAVKNLAPADAVWRQRLWIVEHRLMPCYRVYRPEAVLWKILSVRFGRARGFNTIEDLSADDLMKLIMTLEARVNSARNEAGDSHHGMCLRAGVKRWKSCPKACAECRAESVKESESEGEMEQEIAEATEGNPF